MLPVLLNLAFLHHGQLIIIRDKPFNKRAIDLNLKMELTPKSKDLLQGGLISLCKALGTLDDRLIEESFCVGDPETLKRLRCQ